MMKLVQNTFVAIMLLSVFSHSFATPDTTGPDVSHPAPSPDGDKVAFASNAGMTKTYDIWIAERDGKSPRVLLAWGDSDEKYPDWSHDSKKIVFCSWKSGTSHLWEIDVTTGGVTQLTNGPGNNCQPRYSPDGQTILFLSDRSGKRELWMMNTDGTEQKAIAFIPLKVSDPAWSPDGDRVVFVGCRDSQCNLYSIAVNGGDAKQITFGPFNDWNPDWGQQGIIFASDRDQVQGLWIVMPNGSGLALLPDSELRGDMYPRWDNSKGTIIFARYSGDSRGNLPQVFEFVWAEASEQLTDVTGESTSSNQRPIANAGPDQTKQCVNTSGAVVTLDGSGSQDPDGDPLTFAWSGPFGNVSGETATVDVPLGTHTISLEVVDGNGAADTDTVQVSVEDRIAPMLQVSVAPETLWPPNNKMVPITVTVTATDACDAAPRVTLKGITSNEPTKPGDIVVDAQGNISLRATRAGRGSGRVYTITYLAEDASGNTAIGSATVTVPHDQRR